ncbi:uncharacterized protein [Pocillopora verrucosa]|uniref:uncharacterized protein n=1 Tax=Pocillopora verrucosa TaxID=203993 RepID=UPI00334168D5
MKGSILIIVLLIALPCALGIKCLSCKFGGLKSMCDSVSNSSYTNCTGVLDACVTTGMMVKLKLGMEKQAYTMTCGQMTLCSKLETENCGPEGVRKYVDKIPGVKVTKCGVACCQTDMCNNKDLVKPKPLPPVALAAFTSASLMASCISLLLGFALMV